MRRLPSWLRQVRLGTPLSRGDGKGDRNERQPGGLGHDAMHECPGSYIPLPEPPQERQMTGDRRHSILERYPSRAACVAAIAAKARGLDAERAVKAAGDWSRPRHDVRPG